MNFAVIGHPIRHSLSPIMHHANFKVLSRDDTYCALNIDPNHFHHIKSIVEEKALDGFNVTIPYKERIIDYCDVLDDAAEMIGAVNTVYIKSGVWYGYNTDGIGYLKSIQALLRDNMKILVLGAGGASRAISYTLSQSYDVSVVNRNLERMKDWPFEVEKITYPELKEMAQYDLVINTTPIGMTGFNNTTLIQLSKLSQSCIVSDIIYTPETTEFLKSAQARNLKTINGLGMFVQQGAKSFEIWTGVKADIDAMTLAVQTALKGRR
ncbi:shikimate dehydrogenase [Macrococcoides caseolyticum]|uniref:shikimate dehydrogenase n=1 Tax=Macrococcoides caseolyticum TaxID=69966 RepID=UPI001F21CFA8|nr:shikimate dehydrogenase [Macrococcus caseolyticus]MCE4956175.1 shikimate dehydrogenase [Macrococcus caseolyticus]